MAPAPLPHTTRCAQCRHPLSFHRDGGRCLSKGCGRNTGERCQQFRTPQDAPDPLPAPEPARISEALETIVAAVEHSPGTSAKIAGAAALTALLSAAPALRKAASAHPGRLPERITACLEPPTAPQDAEVATDNAPRERPV